MDLWDELLAEVRSLGARRTVAWSRRSPDGMLCNAGALACRQAGPSNLPLTVIVIEPVVRVCSLHVSICGVRVIAAHPLCNLQSSNHIQASSTTLVMV